MNVDLELFTTARSLLTDFHPFQSEFQLQASVLGPCESQEDPEISAFGLFRQCQREIDARISSLTAQCVTIQDLEIRLAEQVALERSWWSWSKLQRLKKRRASLEVARLRWEFVQHENSFFATKRELEYLVGRATEVAEIVRAWSEDKQKQVERLWWLTRYERRLKSAVLYGGRAAEIVEAFADMPLNVRQTLQELTTHPKLQGNLTYVPQLLQSLGTPGQPSQAFSTLADSYGQQQLGRKPESESRTPREVERLQCSLPRQAMAY